MKTGEKVQRQIQLKKAKVLGLGAVCVVLAEDLFNGTF
jgi:hypothetical protein